MRCLSFIILLMLPFFVNAMSLGKLARVNLVKPGNKTIYQVVKDGGTHTPVGTSKAVGSNILETMELPAGATLQVLAPAKPNLASKLVKMSKNPWFITAASVACWEFTSICPDTIQGVKDWLKDGALGRDNDGNFFKKTNSYKYTNCITSPSGYQGSSPYLACVALATGNVPGYTQVTTIDDVWNGSVYSGSCKITRNTGTFVYQAVSCSGATIDSTTNTIIADSEAQTILENTSITEANAQKVIEYLHEVATSTGHPEADVETNDPVIQDTGFPTRTDLPTTEEISPDGQVIKKENYVDCVKTSSSTMECQQVTNVTITNNDNSVTTDTIYNAPADTTLTKNSTSEDYCKDHPDIIGCSKYGDVPKAETIPVTNATITLNPTSLGSGTCPSPKVMTLSNGRQSVTMSYQTECNFAEKLKPVLLAFAWLAAGFMVVGSLKEA